MINCIVFFSFLPGVKAENINKDKRILVIGSYESGNSWEEQVAVGLKKSLSSSCILRFEYMDSDSFNSKNYYSDFLDLLNTKYKDSTIDYIVTMDDEALDFAITNLFNENSIFYKKHIFFLGVNNIETLKNDVREYVSGILDVQDINSFLEFIKEIMPKVTDIYLLLDESAYCDSLKNSISNDYLNSKNTLRVHLVRSNYISDVDSALSNVDDSKSALIITGTFYIDDSTKIYEKDTIERIQKVSSAPLFTTLMEYAVNGAIGGIMNYGQKIGGLSGKYVLGIINNLNADKGFIITPTVGSLDSCVINFKAMRKAGINPFKLPKDTMYINKGKFDFAVPRYLIFLIIIIAISIIIFVVGLLISNIKNKKESEKSAIELTKSKEREKIKTDYIITLSHELRTPLNIIMNTITLLKDRIVNNGYDEEYFVERIDYITNNSNRLFKSINDVIDAAKIDSNVINFHLEMYNIVEIIEEVVSVTAEFAKQYGVEIVFDPMDEEIIMAVDKRKIEAIILNFISNAIKNIINKGTIYISCKRDKENVYISIKDNGIGMSEEAQKHIFEKYFQVESDILNRRNEGHGLGLYISKGFIDLHNGSIEVKSIIGVGTTFIITLPIKIVEYSQDNNNVIDNDMEQLVKLEFADIIKNKRKM